MKKKPSKPKEFPDVIYVWNSGFIFAGVGEIVELPDHINDGDAVATYTRVAVNLFEEKPSLGREIDP